MNNGSAVLLRWVPLLAWLMVGATCIGVFSKTLSYGYIPPGDARRYVAKAVTDKEYGQILVLGPTYYMDFSPGWESLLRRLHRSIGMEEDGLMVLSAGGLLLLILCAGLPWLRYPEAWLAVQFDTGIDELWAENPGWRYLDWPFAAALINPLSKA
jgi:hypothetical protein